MPSLRAVLPAAAAASVVLLAGALYCLGYHAQVLRSGRGLGGRAVSHAVPRHARGDGGGGMPSAGVRCLCAGSVRRVRAGARLFADLAVACGAADHHGVGQRVRAWPGAAVPGRAGLPAGWARPATDPADHSRRRIQRHDVRAGTRQRRSADVRDGDARGKIAHDGRALWGRRMPCHCEERSDPSTKPGECAQSPSQGATGWRLLRYARNDRAIRPRRISSRVHPIARVPWATRCRFSRAC